MAATMATRRATAAAGRRSEWEVGDGARPHGGGKFRAQSWEYQRYEGDGDTKPREWRPKRTATRTKPKHALDEPGQERKYTSVVPAGKPATATLAVHDDTLDINPTHASFQFVVRGDSPVQATSSRTRARVYSKASPKHVTRELNAQPWS